MAGRTGRTRRRSASSSPSAKARPGASSPTARRTARCGASARRCSSAGSTPERPVAILSDNSIDHALLCARRDARRRSGGADLARVFADVEGLRQAQVHLRAAEARAWCSPPMRRSSRRRWRRSGRNRRRSRSCWRPIRARRMEREHAKVAADTVAKILFTSGSTGAAEGRDQYARACCARTSSSSRSAGRSSRTGRRWWSTGCRGATPSAATTTSTWCLRNGGTLYIDGGKPVPGLVETTVKNLREISPTMYFNVPRGFDLLLPFLERDDEAARALLPRARCALLCRGGAAAEPVGPARGSSRSTARGDASRMLSAWGSTETRRSPPRCTSRWSGPASSACRSPGASSSSCRNAGKLRGARARAERDARATTSAPDLTAGGVRRGGLLSASATRCKLADADDPAKGIVFDGRVAEDFKLTTGTWVNVGAMRVEADRRRAIRSCRTRSSRATIATRSARSSSSIPAAKERRCRRRCARELQARCRKLRDEGGSSTHAARGCWCMTEPPSIDANEITDKGYINQRAVLERRAALVEKLYAGGRRRHHRFIRPSQAIAPTDEERAERPAAASRCSRETSK